MNKTFFTTIILVLNTFFGIAQNSIETSNALLDSIVTNSFTVGASGSYSVNGEVIWEAASGYADKDKKQNLTLDTEIRIASIAKSMTAIAVMQLVEKGLLDINLPIDTYIPEFVQNGKTKITTKHLLSHTSGIGAYKNSKEGENKIIYTSLLDVYEVFKDRKLRFEPGTEFYYSSYGYVVLGILIEKIAGTSYETYMQTHIWDRAEMTNTGIENPNIKRENATTLYQRDRKGKIKQAKANNLTNRVPAGGMYSTVNDIIKFGNAIINHTLINDDTYEHMVQHHSLEKVNNGYGFGFFLYGGKEKESSVIGHSGSQSGSSTQFFVIPSSKTVIIMMANTAGAGREVSTVAAKLIGISQQKD